MRKTSALARAPVAKQPPFQLFLLGLALGTAATGATWSLAATTYCLPLALKERVEGIAAVLSTTALLWYIGWSLLIDKDRCGCGCGCGCRCGCRCGCLAHHTKHLDILFSSMPCSQIPTWCV